MNKLEAAYKAFQVPYPPDRQTNLVDEQEKQAAKEYEVFLQISKDKIRQCEDLAEKLRIMIPYPQMTLEDYYLTFPEWAFDRNNPSVEPHLERQPGITKEQRKEFAKPDPYPMSLP